MLLFFVILGLTNLTKGLFFGTALTLLPVAGFLLTNRLSGLRRFVWLWGWLAYAATALAWPILVYLRYPDALEFWQTDYIYRALSEVARTRWYYFINLPWMLVPWAQFAVVGFWLTRPGRQQESNRGRWFLLCWAFLPSWRCHSFATSITTTFYTPWRRGAFTPLLARCAPGN